MATKLIQLKTTTGNVLLPQTSINNLVGSDNSTPIRVATLDANGKLDGQFIPTTIDDIVELIAMQATAPETCAEGDKYFNTSTEGASAKKIFTATAANTWGTTGEDPITGVIYLDLATDRIWRWSGSQMVEISEQISTNTYANGGIPTSLESCSDEFVPTTKAVRAAITASEYELPAATTTSLGGVIVNTAASNGIALAVDASGNLSVTGATATTSAFGTVVIDNTASNGVQLGISNGTVSISASTASDSAFGTIKVDETASNGVSLDIDGGTVKVVAGTAASNAYGTVQLATASDITEDDTTANATKALTPASIAAALAGKQSLFTSKTNVTITGTSIAVADAGADAKGVVTVNGATNANSIDATGSADFNNVPCSFAVAKALSEKQGTITADTDYVSLSGGTLTTVLQWDEVQNPWA